MPLPATASRLKPASPSADTKTRRPDESRGRRATANLRRAAVSPIPGPLANERPRRFEGRPLLSAVVCLGRTLRLCRLGAVVAESSSRGRRRRGEHRGRPWTRSLRREGVALREEMRRVVPGGRELLVGGTRRSARKTPNSFCAPCPETEAPAASRMMSGPMSMPRPSRRPRPGGGRGHRRASRSAGSGGGRRRDGVVRRRGLAARDEALGRGHPAVGVVHRDLDQVAPADLVLAHGTGRKRPALASSRRQSAISFGGDGEPRPDLHAAGGQRGDRGVARYLAL